jgi:hypothetical protein
MPSAQPSLDQLEQLHELNRLFLGFLQTAARERADCLGFPHEARPALLAASDPLLELAARFPRALFQLSLDDPATPPIPRNPGPDGLRASLESARHALRLTILLCAWTLSRQSVYHARLLLGLESRAMQRLRALQLKDLQGLVHAPGAVLCAFPERPRLWSQLLTETRPEARQQLALIALQPGLEHDWPGRRTPRVSPT